MTVVVTGLLLTIFDGAVRGRVLAPRDAWARISGRIAGLVGLSVLVSLIIAVPAIVLLIPIFIVVSSGGSPVVLAVLAVPGFLVVAYLGGPAGAGLRPGLRGPCSTPDVPIRSGTSRPA